MNIHYYSRWLNELSSWITNNSCKPITNTASVRAQLCKLQKRVTRLAAVSDKVYQLLAHGRWDYWIRLYFFLGKTQEALCVYFYLD
jgi:hypothetical protein